MDGAPPAPLTAGGGYIHAPAQQGYGGSVPEAPGPVPQQGYTGGAPTPPVRQTAPPPEAQQASRSLNVGGGGWRDKLMSRIQDPNAQEQVGKWISLARSEILGDDGGSDSD